MKLFDKHPLPWRSSTMVQNDGSVAVLDANDERVARVDGGGSWKDDSGVALAKAVADLINRNQ